MSRGDSIGPNPRRRAVAFCGSVLIAYVGVAHDVVGSTLYPDGPEQFGGSVSWYGFGLGLTAIGLVMAAATLGLLRAPVAALAAAVSLLGAFVVAGSAFQDKHFHFFAFTMVVAGAAIVVAGRGGEWRSTQSDADGRGGRAGTADR